MVKKGVCAFCVFDIMHFIRVTQVSLISTLSIHHWVRKMKEYGVVCSGAAQLCGRRKVMSGLFCCSCGHVNFDTEDIGREAGFIFITLSSVSFLLSFLL